MLRHVIAREFKVLMQTKAQIVSMILTMVLLIAGIVALHFLSESQKDTGTDKIAAVQVALAPEMKEFEQALEQTEMIRPVLLEAQPDYGEWLKAEAGKDEPVSEIVLAGTPEEPIIFRYGESKENDLPVQVIQKTMTFAQVGQMLGGFEPGQAEKLDRAMNIPVTFVAEEENLVMQNPFAFVTAIVIMCFILFSVITGLSTLTTGVVEEKSSRVVEILLSSVRPRTLLLGKILGIGAFILFQLVLYAIVAVAALVITGMLNFSVISVSTLAWIPVWLLIGFFTYMSIAGGMASMVSRQEDLGAIITPFILFMMVPFYLGLYLVPYLPDWIGTKVFSLIPGFAPFMMPIRQALEIVGIGEVLLSILISLVCIPLLGILAGKIYENSILRMGQRVTFKEVFFDK